MTEMSRADSSSFGVNEASTSSESDAPLTRARSTNVLRRQLQTLATRYEHADGYNRAALEPVIRKALARAGLDEREQGH
jgi:hypothetical protein